MNSSEVQSTESSLWQAAYHNDVESIDTFVDMRDEVGRSALHVASSRGHIASVQFLLQVGSDVHNRDVESGWTPLHRALFHGHISVAIILIRAGAFAGFEDAPNQARPWLQGGGSCGDRVKSSKGRHSTSSCNSSGGGQSVDQLSHSALATAGADGVLCDKDGLSPLALLSARLQNPLAATTRSGIGGECFSFGSESADFQLGYPAAAFYGSSSLSSSSPEGRLSSVRPRRVRDLAHHNVVCVAAGKFHSLAVTHEGLLFSWGHGRGGRLGHGDEEVRLAP
eukprot:CAMPEP_0171752676 /NCGR_PEP_ID=MMETSP0991-20121206/42769_1 /TAXON_ID=483369 /ORGANISM="non described non described, Strain CCMP2098" /LENGTH=280 /DNA_ID=CAMNT_0012354127 /DNA_START=121 /DNA_END=960 /DNA_ORIENTATION=+